MNDVEILRSKVFCSLNQEDAEFYVQALGGDETNSIATLESY